MLSVSQQGVPLFKETLVLGPERMEGVFHVEHGPVNELPSLPRRAGKKRDTLRGDQLQGKQIRKFRTFGDVLPVQAQQDAVITEPL